MGVFVGCQLATAIAERGPCRADEEHQLAQAVPLLRLVRLLRRWVVGHRARLGSFRQARVVERETRRPQESLSERACGFESRPGYVGIGSVGMSQSLVELAAGPARVTIDARAGGRLASLSVAGLELLVGGEGAPRLADGVDWGCYPMAPWVGRIRRGRFSFDGRDYRLKASPGPHPLHGTVLRRPWEVEHASERVCALRTELGPEWPFAGWATQLIELEANRLALTLEVHTQATRMPASCGWHPWWRRDLSSGGALELEFSAGCRLEHDRELLPTGARLPVGDRPAPGWDDCFSDLEGPAVLRWPGALELTMTSDCPYLVVYDQPAHAVCVEPQTAPPDAVNLGAAAVVEAGAPLVAHTSWRWVLG